MRKITSLLALLLSCMVGVNAQVTGTLVTGYGDPLTLTQFKALAGTNGRFAFVASSNTASDNSPRCDHWCGFTSTHNTTTLSDNYLFYLEASGSNYKVKRASDNLYVKTSTSSTSFGNDGSEFKLVNRNPNDATAAVWGEQSISFEDPSSSGNHYNANAVKYNGGAGAWTTYAVFGPIYKNVTIQYVDANDIEVLPTESSTYRVGGTVTAPVIAGKAIDGNNTATINVDDQTITFRYIESTFDYDLVVNNAPAGTTMTIKGEGVAIDATSYTASAAVTESDVVVTVPAGFEYLTPSVTISGTTITVNFEDTRWPINFSKDQTFTRSDRHINSVSFNDQTVTGLYENTSTKCYQDLTETKIVTLPINSTVKPVFNASGVWQHGFVYIDINNDGDFTDDGELVSKINTGNPNLATDIPEFTSPDAAGTYRMRIKTDWSSEDPGGNPGADINDITSSNHIISNGGMIVDMTLVLKAAHDVTFRVVDADNNELVSLTQAEPVGSVITEFPASLLYTDFYDYSSVPETTVDADKTITITATVKANPLVLFTADASNPIWNVLKIKDEAYVTYVVGGTPNVTLPTSNANDYTTQWAFVGTPYSGFHIMNRAAGTSLVLGSELAGNNDDNGGNTYATLGTGQTYEIWTLRKSSYLTDKGGFYIYNAEGQYLNNRSSANLAYWTGGHDKGSTFTATKVLEGSELFDAVIAELKTIPLGTGLNQYSFTGSYAEYSATKISELETQGYTVENLELAQGLLANYALNLPSAGFYRIKGNTSGKYLTCGFASNKKFAMTDATDATTIFHFNGSKLVNYSDGKVNKLTASKVNNVSVDNNGWNWTFGYEDGAEVEFLDGVTNGGYAIKSETVYLYDNGDNSNSADRGTSNNITADNTRYRSWYLEPVASLEVTLTNCKTYLYDDPDNHADECYTTLYMPVKVKVTGAEVYTIKASGTENSFDMETVDDGVVPAETGVILKNATGTATATVCDDASSLTSLLTGTVPATAYNANAYVLSVANQTLGLYKLADTNNMKGFRAYYVPTSGNADPTRGFVLNFGETTGVGSVVLGSNDNAYDLQGRRVNNAQKGVFIINGKKVVK